MAIVKEYEMKVNTADAQKNVGDLNKDIKKTGSDLSGVSDAADKATGGMVSGFKGALGAIKKVVLGFKTMKGAIAATGIGALVIVVTSLAAAFAGSEEGQNKFAKIMTVIGALTGNLIDLLADFGETIIKIFENPKESAVAFGKILKDQIVNRVVGVIELLPALGKALKLVFQGEFTKAAGVASNAAGKIVLGIEDTVGMTEKAINATKKFTEEQIKEGKAAAAVADMRAKADKIERSLVVDRSKLESEIALLRLKSRQEEEFSATERKQALLDAQVLEDSLLDKETEFLELRRDAQIAENTFSRSNKENLTKEAEAIAAVNRQQATRANTARQVQREVNTISKQIQAEDNKIIAEKKRKDAENAKQESDAEKALSDLKTKIRDASAVQEDDIRNLEIIKVKEHYANLINLAKENGLDVVALEKAQSDKINSLSQKNAKNEIYWEKLTQDQKAKIISGGLNNLATILGQETAAGKAAAIASATIDTFQSAQASYKSLAGIPVVGPALGVAAAGAAIASGFKQVQAIRSTKLPTLAGQPSPDVGGGGTASPQAAQIPSFNIVGQTGTNQLADAIAGQNGSPVKAFVVASDVTTAQSLERNIIEGASL